ncbi:Integrase [Paramixta manurensis]|uniref:Integrase n=1 Tax=Paramixta manurensis TaxID=2740817 RepID=A0A6M8UAA5_9GAMM|nr:Integrase [Erwiniaceae bacterium PD-1]
MSLNDTKIRSLKPSAKPFKVSDSHGLYLLVNPSGSRLWYLKYRFNRKESRIALGAYPALPLDHLTELLERVEGYHQGCELARFAVLLILHLFIRSSELRFARWSEIDFRNRVWTIWLYSFLIVCLPILFKREEHSCCPSDKNSINEKLERVHLEPLDETFRNHRTCEQCDADGKSTCDDGRRKYARYTESTELACIEQDSACRLRSEKCTATHSVPSEYRHAERPGG